MKTDFNQNISQELRQTQRLSPMQMQLVRLLEMSAPELDEEIQRQLDDNPALTTADEHENDSDDIFTESAEQLQEADYASDEDIPFAPPARNTDLDTFRPEIRDTPQTLQENLAEQIDRTECPQLIARIARYIIGNIDDNGYLTRNLRAMATDLEVAGIEVTQQQMRRAFDLVRELDPAGVGAVDLRDCLLLQLRRLNPSEKDKDNVALATEIVSDYFDLLGKKHFDRMMREMKIDNPDRLKRAIDIIRSLNPKPGGTSSDDGETRAATAIIPDFSVEIIDDRAVINLLSASPELQIEQSFRHEADIHDPNPRRREASAFIKLKRDEATAFINILQRRAETMMSVMRAIVNYQWQFFVTGDVATLRPLVLRELSASTGLDISVISRVTQGKYVSTDHGTFPLKMFLNERTSDDSDTTSHSLRQAVRSVIDNEDPANPLSDQAICDALAKKGISVARRTVTKYRERMGLPPGRLRKKL
ncbi:MAG: RNA polymerase factor sigma-54 [Muribaculaceae bacterium]